MQPYQKFIEGDDSVTVDALTATQWTPTVYIGKPGPTRLHAWSKYPNQRHGFTERLYHAKRIEKYLSRDAAIQWWKEVGGQAGDLKVAVAQARAIVAGKNTDADDFAIMLEVQRRRFKEDGEFREALGTWVSGHIVERAPASATDKRWGTDAQANGRNLLGIVLMRIARENGIGPQQTEATTQVESTPNTDSHEDLVLPW